MPLGLELVCLHKEESLRRTRTRFVHWQEEWLEIPQDQSLCTSGDKAGDVLLQAVAPWG